MAESGVISEIMKRIESVFNRMKESVGDTGRYDHNFGSLRKILGDVYAMKADLNIKVKDGEDRREVISRQAASWLKDVQKLTENEELKKLMYVDSQTARLVVRLMEKSDLKRSLVGESEMQSVVVNVMTLLKGEIEESDQETVEIAGVEYKKVAGVIAELIEDIFEKFRNALKEDMEMAAVAMKMLNDRNLETLTRGDDVMEKIIMEARDNRDKEPCLEHEDDSLKQVARNLITPMGNWLTGLRKLVDDAYFNQTVPHAGLVQEWLDLIVELWIKSSRLEKAMGETVKPYECCRYHDQNEKSKAAQIMVDLIQCDLLPKYPYDSVTRSLVFNSKEKLLDRILEKLRDDQVNVVGVFGMGGIGKTVLVKEINKKAKDIFNVNVMVEVLDTPDIIRIQAAIAESIDLPLHGVHISQRADRLHGGLTLGGKKVLIILDNVWKKLNLEEIGIPSTCKILLTTRERDLCREMSVRDMNILEVGIMEANEARDLLKSHIRDQVVITEHENVVERLLSKCGGLPHAIVSTANALQDTDVASWENFADNWGKGISNKVTYNFQDAYSILDKSYKFITVVEKKIFFLLICLFPAGSSVSIESLARYSIGLNLFQPFGKLSEAMETADKWAKELISLSMLIESNVKCEVKIHDFMRTFAISLAAAAEKYMFMEKGSPSKM